MACVTVMLPPLKLVQTQSQDGECIQESQSLAAQTLIWGPNIHSGALCVNAGGMQTASLMQRQARARMGGRFSVCQSTRSTVMHGMRPAKMTTSAMMLLIMRPAGSPIPPCIRKESALRRVATARPMQTCSVRYLDGLLLPHPPIGKVLVGLACC